MKRKSTNKKNYQKINQVYIKKYSQTILKQLIPWQMMNI